MWTRRSVELGVLLFVVTLSGSCATTKTIQQNAERVIAGQSVDTQGMKRAVESDTKDVEANLQQLHHKFMEALAKLTADVQQKWGQKETKVANRTVYVKYTQNYKSRVVTDFDHGVLTVETLDDKDPQASLMTAIVNALLTSSDPSSVDLFSDKDVALSSGRTPYLYGLVLDNQGKPIRTRDQAEAYAHFLVPQHVQSRAVQSDEGPKTARFVRLAMVRNFEDKGADRYRGVVKTYSDKYQVSPSLVLAIIRTESNFNPFAVSSAPAYGLMQLVPTSGGRTAYRRVNGVDETPSREYLFDPDHNIQLGTAYLSVLSENEFHPVGNQSSRDYCVIAAYNTGAGNVTRTFSKDRNEAMHVINGLQPPALYEKLRTSLPHEETRLYLVKVTGYRRQYGDSSTPSGANP